MIKSLSLVAFKSFPAKTIDFKPLTLLSGLNNSGKSSIIQALRMYGRASEGRSPLLDGHGSISEVRSHSSSKSQPIEITCDFNHGLSSCLALDGSAVTKPEHFPVYTHVSADRLGPQSVLPLRRSLDTFPFLGERGEYVLDFLQKLGNGLVPDKLIQPGSQGRTLSFVLAGWLQEVAPGVKLDFIIDDKADFARAEIDTYRPTNVGFGLSYTLPVIAGALGMAVKSPSKGWEESWGSDWDREREERGALLIVENPEAHLHPYGQTLMGRLLALAASCGVQVVVETHSDHLMDGIRIAVKEQLLSSADVVFHYLSKNKEGLTDVDTPNIGSDGKLHSWPQGFFDQTLRNRAILAKKS